MANDSLDTLINDFGATQWQGSSGNQAADDSSDGLVEALESAVQAASGTVRPTTTTSAQSQNQSSQGDSTLSKILKSGLGLGGLVADLYGLFGGGGSSPAPEPVKYAMPAPVDINTALTSSGLVGADYNQTGGLRTYGNPTVTDQPAGSSASSAGGALSIAFHSVASGASLLSPNQGVPANQTLSGTFEGVAQVLNSASPDDVSPSYLQPSITSGEAASTIPSPYQDGDGATGFDASQPAYGSLAGQVPPNAAAPTAATWPNQQSRTGPAAQITVNVQALDAQSLMDRSSDIAAAVRNAMLNLNPINDVVNDL